MTRLLVLLAALAGGGAAWAQAPLPEAVAAFTRENLEACRGAGGTPSLQGLAFPGAGETAEVHSPYVTETELNGDGQPDFVTDLAGLECANAWSYFCGSAGCPVTVWLSGPEGHTVAWGGSAQAWRLEGAGIVLSLHGQLCSPPRVGADGCEMAIGFGAAAGAAPAPAEAAAPAPAEAGAPAPAEAAAPPASVPPPAPAAGWVSGQIPGGSGWFAGVADPSSGRRIDWLCAKGRGSFLALSPYAGGARIVVNVGGRLQEADVTVENGAAYAPIDTTAPLFLHLLSGPATTISEPGGPPLGTFTLEGAPVAIGRAEGRCRF